MKRFSQPIIDMVMDQIAGAHSDLALKVYGDDITKTRHLADQVVNVLKQIPGAADVKMTTGASTISREMNKRHLTIHVNLRGVDLTAFLHEAEHRIHQTVEYNHNDIHLQWAGHFENQHRAYNRLGAVVPLALGIMLLLLFAACGKFRQDAVITGTKHHFRPPLSLLHNRKAARKLAGQEKQAIVPHESLPDEKNKQSCRTKACQTRKTNNRAARKLNQTK